MLTGKYINKYYLKYALFFIIGVVALIAVDYFQLEIPKFLMILCYKKLQTTQH